LAALAACALVVAAAVTRAHGIAVDAVTSIVALSSCAVSFNEAHLLPLTVVIPIAFGAASIFGLARGLIACYRERRVINSLPLLQLEHGELATIAQSSGVVVFETPASRPVAFCCGLAWPRVVVTSGLLERLSADEQLAAFWHEAEHVRTHEPLRTLLSRLAQDAFFWLPVLKDLFARYALTRELNADRVATTHTSVRALAAALHEASAAPAMAGVVGFADFAGARVDRLVDPSASLPRLFRWQRVGSSAVAVALLTLAFAVPANVSVASRGHEATMMMEVSILTPTGIKTILVPCG
jgi:beta-lactamase regulating signal transducer with metallopeptidase domain